MIRIVNQGGLGNQLFIWNAAHEIASMYQDKVTIIQARRSFFKPTLRPPIKVLESYCDHNIIIKSSLWINFLLRIIDKPNSTFPRLSFSLKKLFGLQDVINHEAIPSLTYPKPKWIRGFFQDGENVWKNRNVLNLEIGEFLNEIRTKLPEKLSIFISTEYQAFHIRRGDYRIDESKWGLLSLSYYSENKHESFPILVSSDDSDIAKELEGLFPKSTFLNPMQYSEWETFLCLASSRYLLMANSTFSWWASLFVSLRNGTTIAPRPWFYNMNISSSYLVRPGIQFKKSLFESK
jgi:hypothetical protein